jgi:hypothetical protein
MPAGDLAGVEALGRAVCVAGTSAPEESIDLGRGLGARPWVDEGLTSADRQAPQVAEFLLAGWIRVWL